LIRKLVWECIPRNNFAENPRKFPGIFSGNPRKFPGIFYWKIRWKCWQLFQGISRNSFWGTRYKKFLLTHSEEILIILSKEFLVTNSAENRRKCRQSLWEIIENFQWKALQNQFLGTIPKIFSRVPQEYLKIFSAYSWINPLTRTQVQFCGKSAEISRNLSQEIPAKISTAILRNFL